MTVIRSKDKLKEKLEAASNVSPDHPVVITKFIEGAEEIDCDGVVSPLPNLLLLSTIQILESGTYSRQCV